jgi:uncharacterized protein YyaL (SSP411 family)
MARPKDLQDTAVPWGGAMSATVLLKLLALTGDGRYYDAAQAAIAQVVPLAQRYPTAFAQWLNAICFSLSAPVEVALVGEVGASDMRVLLDVARESFRPFAVVAAGPSDGTAVPLLLDRPQRDGRATAYVCRNFACRAPVTEPADLQAQLASSA